jgi:acetylornithine deacetylase
MDTVDIAALAAELVRVESVNPALDPAGSGELRCAEVVRAWAAAHGLAVFLDEYAPGRANVVVRAGRGNGPATLVLGHLDTVGTATMRDPFAGTVREGRIRGRGAYDMKGAVAAALAAAVELERESFDGAFVVACVADEEHASTGAERLISAGERPGFVLVAEPTDERLCVAHRGFAGFEIVTHGRAAHGSRPDLGIDAIAAMGTVLARLDARAAELLRTAPHPLLGTPSLHASLISGGQEFSSYPERCVLEGERRTLPGETDGDVAAEVAALAAGVDAKTRLVFTRPPLELDPGHELPRAVAAAAGAGTFEGVPFWTDGALFAAAGLPVVIYGPRGGGAHAAEEWVEAESLARCARVYAEAARRLAGGPGGKSPS